MFRFLYDPVPIFYTPNIFQFGCVNNCKNLHVRQMKNCLLESRMTLENNWIWIEDRM